MKKMSASVLALLLAAALAIPAAAAEHGLEVVDLGDASLSAADLASSLVTEATDDVQIVDGSVDFSGDDRAAGSFTGGAGIIGFDAGIILSSGQAVDVVGPNGSPNTTTAFDTPGDAALSALAGFPTHDAAILEFEFEVPEGAEQVFFSYVFGSEEYNEYVASQFNDVFAFWVNGENCAVVGDGDPVSVNTINHGTTSDEDFDPVNPELFINNDPFHGHLADPPLEVDDAPYDTEMDGFTVPLTCEAAVDAGDTNTMRLAIADGSDTILDSWVLIRAGSLSVTPPDMDPVPDQLSVELQGFAAEYVQGADATGNEQVAFTYTQNDGDIEQIFNVFTIDGFTSLADYQSLFADLDYDDYIRGLEGTSAANVNAPDTRDVAIDFTLQDDAPVGDYTLRITSYDVTGVDADEVSLGAALGGDYATLDDDSLDAAVVTLSVRRPAAPAIAAELLRDADEQGRYGKGRNGGNHIQDVAAKMTEDHATDFEGISKEDGDAYRCAVATYLNTKTVSVAVSTDSCPPSD